MSDEQPPKSAGSSPISSAEGNRHHLLHLEKALETMQVGVTITDCERNILYVNPAEAAMHGYAVDELLGESARIFAPESLWRPVDRQALKKYQSWRRESVNTRQDGSSFPVELQSDVVLDQEGEPIGIVTIAQDISLRKEAERALRESEERYALAVRGANDGLWDWNVATDEIYFSPRWSLMLGHEESGFGNDIAEWWNRVHPEDLPRLKEQLQTHLDGESDHFQCEHRIAHADGTYRQVLARGIAVRDRMGEASRMAGSLTDITDRKVHDPLTGLPNRALFLDRLASALGRARRRKKGLTAVLFLDLDRFKVVNDSLGHLAGDQLLVSVARRFEASLRPGDTVARLGGDEFTILLEEVEDVPAAEMVAERVLERLSEPMDLAGHEIFTTASIGIAVSEDGRDKPQDLLRDADTAMYRAKALGRGEHQLFDEEMRISVVSQLQIESDLRRALDRGELQVYYQPILSLETDRIVGFEALARWNHPQQGLLLPHDFIPIAEETGLIMPLGDWVLFEACRQLRELQGESVDGGRLTMNVNLSPKQFNSPGLVRQVESVLEQTGVDAACLKLEITEGTFIENPEKAIEMMKELRRMGVQVVIDDFGTGYSSLSYLHRFPVDSLKIDRIFVSRIDRPGKQSEMVQNIIRMARDLSIEVVAEGVETATQRKRLVSLSCGQMQGFSFSEPLPADELRLFLARFAESEEA